MSRGGLAALPRGATGCLQFVIVVFPDHTHLLFLKVHFYRHSNRIHWSPLSSILQLAARLKRTYAVIHVPNLL